MELQDLEYYWLNAPALFKKITIGQYVSGRWRIDGQTYNEGPGIYPISHIRRPA